MLLLLLWHPTVLSRMNTLSKLGHLGEEIFSRIFWGSLEEHLSIPLITQLHFRQGEEALHHGIAVTRIPKILQPCVSRPTNWFQVFPRFCDFAEVICLVQLHLQLCHGFVGLLQLHDIYAPVCHMLCQLRILDHVILIRGVGVDISPAGSDCSKLHRQWIEPAGLIVVLQGCPGTPSAIKILPTTTNVPGREVEPEVFRHAALFALPCGGVWGDALSVIQLNQRLCILTLSDLLSGFPCVHISLSCSSLVLNYSLNNQVQTLWQVIIRVIQGFSSCTIRGRNDQLVGLLSFPLLVISEESALRTQCKGSRRFLLGLFPFLHYSCHLLKFLQEVKCRFG
mmetsp:Transcript_23484/g.30696  ORF Transcript_23484/g.30696 Transcript_23484/m.30696 type:complete len:338 (+) Transcript_23484:1632-2645(+)